MGYIPVGRVLSTRGLRGELRFRYYNDSEPNLCGYATLYADRDGRKIELRPSRVQALRGQFVIQFEKLETPGAVSFLIGKELYVREEDLPRLSEGEYYDYQLIGLRAINEHDEPIGQVTEVIHTKATDVIVIEGERELLIPMQEGFILGIDVDAASIRVAEGAFIE
jgi:16S rRNA processing protein RimM